jgi:hypothetical protein
VNPLPLNGNNFNAIALDNLAIGLDQKKYLKPLCKGLRELALERKKPKKARMEDSKMLKPNDKAPDFSLSDQDGVKRSPADFAGKKLILFFYPKANTGG